MNYEYNFILYKEIFVFGAISNDILRRAMGVSKYRKTRLFLINCSKEFSHHAKSYVDSHLLEIFTVKSAKEANGVLLKNDGGIQLIVTHTWPSTLYVVVSKFQEQNLILIEEVPPLFDRLPSMIRARSLMDRILSTEVALRAITYRYRKAIKSAKKYIAISDYERKVLEKYYYLYPNDIVYEPVDNRYFVYAESERKSMLIFGNPDNKVIRCVINSIGSENIKEIIQINSGLNLFHTYDSNIKITSINHYNFLEMQSLYRKSAVSITDESRGTFELIPIESIMSGVPIISPLVPSLQVLKSTIDSLYTQSEEKCYPYFDYLRLFNGLVGSDKNSQLAEWYFNIDRKRGFFSKVCHELFSIDAVGKDFIAKGEKYLSYDSKK